MVPKDICGTDSRMNPKSQIRAPLTRSEIMKRVGSKNTSPEVTLRKALFAEGQRFRISYKIEGIKVDIVFPRHRLAIFVDGCFWHSCPIHGSKPKSNLEYWLPKLNDNMMRDKRQVRKIRLAGWRVIRLWEHECQQPYVSATKKVLSAISESKINQGLLGKKRKRRPNPKPQTRIK